MQIKLFFMHGAKEVEKEKAKAFLVAALGSSETSLTSRMTWAPFFFFLFPGHGLRFFTAVTQQQQTSSIIAAASTASFFGPRSF